MLTIRYFMRFRENDEDFIGATRPDVAMPTAKQYENLCLPCLRCMCVRSPLVFFNSPPPQKRVRSSVPSGYFYSFNFYFYETICFCRRLRQDVWFIMRRGETPFPPRVALSSIANRFRRQFCLFSMRRLSVHAIGLEKSKTRAFSSHPILTRTNVRYTLTVKKNQKHSNTHLSRSNETIPNSSPTRRSNRI